MAKKLSPAAEFARCLARTVAHEGGRSDHPEDPGGRTNRGVTQRTYDAWRRSQRLKVRDVYRIEEKELQAIYRQQYWNAIQGDRLPAGVSLAVFDGAVNSGPTQAVKWLQRALGNRYQGRIDGVMGAQTLSAVGEHPNHDAIVNGICDRRMAFLQALKGWKTFRRGWTARVADIRSTGLAWASGPEEAGEIVPLVDLEPAYGADEKATIEDAKARPSPAAGDLATGTGTGMATVTQVTDQLSPFQHIEVIGKIVLILTVAGVVIAMGGLAWRAWAKWRAQRLADALDTPRAT